MIFPCRIIGNEFPPTLMGCSRPRYSEMAIGHHNFSMGNGTSSIFAGEEESTIFMGESTIFIENSWIT
jgi:hypothetical protein